MDGSVHSPLQRARHLAGRFARAIVPGRPSAEDEAWVASLLTEREHQLWRKLPNHDRRHAVRVARDVRTQLAATEWAEDPSFLEAALLHDVGKQAAGLGVYGRVVATVSAAVAGRDAATMWVRGKGFTRRVGLYVDHGAIGADMIRLAGGSEAAAAWSAAHHEPPETWPALPIPAPVVAVLDAADNE